MPRDHFLPATFLGRFSVDSDPEMRKRRVYVSGHGRETIRREKAAQVGAVNNYYRLIQGSQNHIVGNTWDKYEERLTAALDELVDPTLNSVDAQSWLRVLIPFVAGIFVRTPHFARRFESKELISTLDKTNILRSDNTNMARLIAMHRILAPIMASKWIVAHTTGADPLIMNDIGYVANQFEPHRATIGWTVPLGRKSSLQLIPCPDGRGRDIMFYAGKQAGWRAFTEHRWLARDNHRGLNRSISASAHEFILGPTYDSVGRNVKFLGQDKDTLHTITPFDITSHRMQIVHEFEWYRLVSSIKYHPRDTRFAEFKIDPEEVQRDWSLPVAIVPANLPEFETALSVHGRTVMFGMSEVPGFTDYAPGRWPWEKQEGN